MLLVNGMLWCLLALIWKSSDTTNLVLKFVIMSVALLNLLTWVKG
jgi:hypothetical protein